MPCRGDLLDFLAAAPENERVAALQPQHALPLLRQPHQQLADVLLRQRMIVRLLADIDARRVAADEIQDARTDQPVVEHHVGALHQPQGAEGEQIGIARPGADQIDLADRLAAGRIVERGELVAQRGLGPGHVARHDALADDAFRNVLPEAAAAHAVADPLGDLGAEAAEKRGQIAEGRRDGALKLRLDDAREDRRGARGRNRGDDRACGRGWRA